MDQPGGWSNQSPCSDARAHTCFEFFLAAEGQAPYWEVNLAPNGAWNLYRLAACRQGLTPVADRDAMPFTVSTGPERLELAMVLLLPQELSQACQRQACGWGWPQ